MIFICDSEHVCFNKSPAACLAYRANCSSPLPIKPCKCNNSRSGRGGCGYGLEVHARPLVSFQLMSCFLASANLHRYLTLHPNFPMPKAHAKQLREKHFKSIKVKEASSN